MSDYVKSVAKAIAAAIVAAATYLAGILGDGSTFDSVTLVQWLGLVPVVLGAFGIIWGVPNTPVEEV